MAPAKTRVPAVDGFFTEDGDAPALLGSRCTACGNVTFPKETVFCRNPRCAGEEFTEVPLSRTGKVWSYTNAGYPPPEPFVVTTDPYQPIAIAAIELAAEQMVVLGQVVAGVEADELHIGDEMELVVDTLYEDDEHEYLTWKWRPAGGANGGATDG